MDEGEFQLCPLGLLQQAQVGRQIRPCQVTAESRLCRASALIHLCKLASCLHHHVPI